MTARFAVALLAVAVVSGELRAQSTPAPFVPIAEAARYVPALQRTVRVDAEQTPLRDALRAVAASAGIDFVWDASIAADGCTVSLRAERLTVARAVADLLSRCTTAESTIEAVVSSAGTLVLRRRATVTGDAGATGALEGNISDAETGSPVAGAYVELEAENRSTWSDATGRFAFASVRVGPHALRVRRMGRVPLRVGGVIVSAGNTLRLALFVKVAPILLANVVISPSSWAALDVDHAAPSIDREQLRMLPQVAEDALRAATRFPGVTSNDFTARLQAIGGTGDDVLVTLDGVELANPYHLRPFGDVVSIVDARALQGMQLSTGGFGAEHGDRIAGVLAMRSITADPGPLRGEVTASALDASTRLMAGLGSRAAWFVSARHGYPERLLHRSGIEDPVHSRYTDLFAKATFGAGDDTVAVHALAAADHFTSNPPDDSTQRGATDHVYLWTTARVGIGRHLELRHLVSFGRSGMNRDASIVGVENDVPGFTLPFLPTIRANDVRETRLGSARQDWRWTWSSRWVTTGGIALNHATTEFDYEMQRDSAGTTTVRDLVADVWARTLTGYATLRFTPAPGTIIELGERYDRQDPARESILSPRALLAWSVDPITTLRFAIGKYAQFQRPYELAIEHGEVRVGQADRATAGGLELERVFPRGPRARIGAYVRSYDRCVRATSRSSRTGCRCSRPIPTA